MLAYREAEAARGQPPVHTGSCGEGTKGLVSARVAFHYARGPDERAPHGRKGTHERTGQTGVEGASYGHPLPTVEALVGVDDPILVNARRRQVWAAGGRHE